MKLVRWFLEFWKSPEDRISPLTKNKYGLRMPGEAWRKRQ